GLGLAVWMQSLPTVEGWSWDLFFFIGFWSLFALSLSALIRLFHLWRSTKRLLDAIALVPMMRAFSRFPAQISDLFAKHFFTTSPRPEHLQLPVRQLRLLAEAVVRDPEATKELADIGRIADALDRSLQEGLDPATTEPAARRIERDLRGKLSAVAAGCLSALA